MKHLVRRYARHFVKWLAADAVFVRALDVELQNQHRFADALLEIVLNGKSGILHIEFQSHEDADMGTRLQEYNVLASHQSKLPVKSYVIYLRETKNVAESPLVRRFLDEEEVHRFFFRTIKMWEIPAELIFQVGRSGLLPIITLTDGGKRPEVVQSMIDRLVSEQKYDLLAIAEILGGLVFKEETEEEFFRRRFKMFQDILRESWVYQEIGREFFAEGKAEGIEKGMQEGLEKGRLEAQRDILLNIVQMHFSELLALAKQKSESIKDEEVLSSVILKLTGIHTVAEAKQILLSIDKDETKH